MNTLNAGIGIYIAALGVLVWYILKISRRIKIKHAIYIDWWTAEQTRRVWRKEHEKLRKDYFYDPDYQNLWDREIFFEARALLNGVTEKETSFQEYLDEKEKSNSHLSWDEGTS